MNNFYNIQGEYICKRDSHVENFSTNNSKKKIREHFSTGTCDLLQAEDGNSINSAAKELDPIRSGPLETTTGAVSTESLSSKIDADSIHYKAETSINNMKKPNLPDFIDPENNTIDGRGLSDAFESKFNELNISVETMEKLNEKMDELNDKVNEINNKVEETIKGRAPEIENDMHTLTMGVDEMNDAITKAVEDAER